MADKANKRKAKEKDLMIKAAFDLEAPEARHVFLAGDFSGWNTEAHPMKKGKKGTWKIKLSLLPGRYEYRYLVDGRWTNDPCCSETVGNGFGGRNCVRVVE